MTFRKTLTALLFCLLAPLSFSQVSVIANLLDGTGSTYKTGYLHFQLENCGANVPNTSSSAFIVQDSFDIHPTSLNGPINGSVVGNDQIYCGNILSTYYVITPMKDATRPLGPGVPYVMCSNNATLGTCSNGTTLGAFNFNTADPMTSPAPTPGFSLVYENPLNDQTLTQPTGTTFYWYGHVDFTHATVTGLSGGGGTTIVLENNGNRNSVQNLLNLVSGANITITEANGNVTISAAGGGSGSGIVINPTGSQPIVQPSGTYFAANNISNILYVTPSWNWTQLPTGSLSAGSNTVTLSPCPLGLNTSNSSLKPFYVYVSLSGTSEAALVTGGTCTSGATSGTLIITTLNSYGSGYSIGSAYSGIQEAINYASTPGAAIVIPPTGANSGALPIYATIYFQSNKASLRGEGKPTLLCKTRSVCLFIGDRSNVNDWASDEVSGLRFAAGSTYDGMQITNTACGSNASTITLTNTGANAVQAGDWVDINWTFNPHYLGLHQVATASTSQFTYTDTNCGGSTTIASQASAGFASLEVAGVEDNATATNLHDIYFADHTSSGSWGYWQNHVVIDNDQAFSMNVMNIDEGPHCTTNYCGQSIYFPGPFGTNAAVAWLDHLNISLQCSGNGITAWNGNTLHVSNSVIQGYAMWGAVTGTGRGGFGPSQFDSVYEEVGACTNPIYPGSGLAQRAEVGLYNVAGSAVVHGGEFPTGAIPQFAATGNQNTRYNYYFVVRDSTNGASKPLPMGYALVDSSSPAGSITVSWPRIQGTGTVTYDVVRSTGTGNAAVSPYNGGCTGGSTTACGSVTTSLAQCSTLFCSYTDSASASTSSYAVPTLQDMPGIFFLPGGAVTVVGYLDSTNFSNTYPIFLDDDSLFSQTLSPLVTENNLTPQIFAQRCSDVNAGEWYSCVAGNSNGNNATPNSLMLQYGIAAGTLQPGSKGRLIFENSILGSVTNGEIITLVDSNPGKTFATAGNRPSYDANDSYIGIDNTSVAVNAVGIAIGAPVSLSNYIGAVPDGSSWLERLTGSAKTFKVPVTLANLASSGNQCLHVNAAGTISGTGSDCSGGTSLPFNTDQFIIGTGSGTYAFYTATQGCLTYNTVGGGTPGLTQCVPSDINAGGPPTGTGVLVLASAPTLVNPILGNASATSLTLSGGAAPSQVALTYVSTACSSPTSGTSYICASATNGLTISIGSGNAFTPGPSSSIFDVMCGGSLGTSSGVAYIFFPANQNTTTCAASTFGANAQEMTFPAGGTVQRLYCSSNGGGNSADVVTFYHNNTSTSLSCAIGTGASPAHDTTHTVTVAAGDTWSVRYVTGTASDGATGMRASFEFVRTP